MKPRFLFLTGLAAAVLLGAPAGSRGQGAGAPLYFSVLKGARGNTLGTPNDVRALANDGARVFLASPSGVGASTVAPATTNVQVFNPPALGLGYPDEIDALSFGLDDVPPPDTTGSFPERDWFFSVDQTAVGAHAGPWPPSVFELSPDRAAPAVFFRFAGLEDHLGVPGALIGLAPMDATNPPDDLDGMDFRTGVGPGVGFPSPNLFFSVGRSSLGLPGSGVRAAQPYPAAAIFVSDWAGNNVLFAADSSIGLQPGDDVDAMVLLDRGPPPDPDFPDILGPPNGVMDPGIDLIAFSVDCASTGRPNSAVRTAANNGSVGGFVFFSAFQGSNARVLKPTELALLDGTMVGQCDEDNLNALDVFFPSDVDQDSIPDVVDNCRYEPNSSQIDTNSDGIGDVCAAGVGVAPLPERAGTSLVLVADPNPFATTARLSFTVPGRGRVRLAIHDVRGRRIATLLDGTLEAGAYGLAWDGRGEDGEPVPPGVYFARLLQGGEAAVRKIARIR